jgi:nucleoside-triphosphatase THEP1
MKLRYQIRYQDRWSSLLSFMWIMSTIYLSQFAWRVQGYHTLPRHSGFVRHSVLKKLVGPAPVLQSRWASSIHPEGTHSTTIMTTAASTFTPYTNTEAYAALTTEEQESVRLQLNIRKDLKQWRKKIAEELQKPQYFFIRNAAIDAIARDLPTSNEELLKITGIGPKSVSYSPFYFDFIQARVGSGTSAPEEYKQKVLAWRLKNSQPNVISAMAAMSTPKVADNVEADDDGAAAPAVGVNKTSARKPRRPASAAGGDVSGAMRTISFSEKRSGSLDDDSSTKLNAEKQAIVSRVLSSKRNFFISGSAGTGKSYLLKHLIEQLRLVYNNHSHVDGNHTSPTIQVDRVAVTAPTGIAAINIGGMTIHSFAGIGLGTGSKQDLINKVLKNVQAVKRWQSTQVLIIDEVSMIDINMFQLLDTLGKTIRKNTLPFGGIRVIVCGDFCQLPPVVSTTTALYEQLIADRVKSQHMQHAGQAPPASHGQHAQHFQQPHQQYHTQPTPQSSLQDQVQYPPSQQPKHQQQHFCFESLAWDDLDLNNLQSFCELQTIVRQNKDLRFSELLNRFRQGIVTPADMETLNANVVGRKPQPVDGIIPTKIYCINKDVDAENAQKLQQLDGDIVKVHCIDKWISGRGDAADGDGAGQELTTARISSQGYASPSTAIRKALVDVANKRIPSEIDLKIGAQVMLLRNMGNNDEGAPSSDSNGNGSGKGPSLANGSRGVVIGFVEPPSAIARAVVTADTYRKGAEQERAGTGLGLIPIVRFDSGRVEKIQRLEYQFHTIDEGGHEITLTRYQLPLKLAWYAVCWFRYVRCLLFLKTVYFLQGDDSA